MATGILNLHKAAGMTSHDVVARVRRILHTKRVGHAGTLDPDAVGVLVVAVGEATRLLPYLPLEPKIYIARLCIGIATNTEDASGTVLETADASSVTFTDLQNVLPRFLGTTNQIPPMVSAVHHEGRRLYQLAREGITVEREERQVVIEKIEASNFMGGASAEATLQITCGGGTYIRTLCADIGAALGLPAHMKNLLRGAVGRFVLANAVSLERLEAEGAACLQSVQSALDFPRILVSDTDAAALTQGKAIPAAYLPPPVPEIFMLLHREQLRALARYEGDRFQPFRVFGGQDDG